MANLKVVVAGAGGRMGQMLIEAVRSSGDCTLHGALDMPGSPVVGKDAAANSRVIVSSDVAATLAGADVLIDFTRPEGTLHHLNLCRRLAVNAVIGTTGFDPAGKETIASAARDIGVVFAPNMSVGVNLAFKLIEVAARATGPGYDGEIVEAHHRNKVDAPSGTALRMGEIAARALGRDHDGVAVFGRKGETGVRRDDAIGYAVVRGGDLVGDHTVMFLGQGERIEITHKASSRSTYAQGALRACRFLRESGAGLFDMHDVLGIR
jgi:4-hydroxy-tetrahydrodipicolinate reductase